MAKKPKPFNPFDPNSVKPKPKPRTDRAAPAVTTPRTGPPPPITPLAAVPAEDTPSRPAIPLTHLPPEVEKVPPQPEPPEEPSEPPEESVPSDETEQDDAPEEPSEQTPEESLDEAPEGDQADEPPEEPTEELPEEPADQVTDEPTDEAIGELTDEPTDEPAHTEPATVDSTTVEEQVRPAAASGLGRRVGLRKPDEPEVETIEVSTEERVSGLIAQSKQSAAKPKKPAPESKQVAVESSVPAEEKPVPSATGINKPDGHMLKPLTPKKERSTFRPRRRKVKPPPAKRVTKLNRRKYMDYKVDMRELLEEEDVPDEHRANVLGTIWAKGERAGIGAALDYLQEKQDEGILSESAANRIRKVVKSYRTER